MIVAIVGSRPNLSWTEGHQTRARNAVYGCIARLPPEDDIVTGDAEGVDTWVRLAAVRSRVVIQVIPAWTRESRSAGPMRNRRIAAICDRMVAFWDGASRGTRSAIEAAVAIGKPVHLVLVGPGGDDEVICRERHAWLEDIVKKAGLKALYDQNGIAAYSKAPR